MILQSDTHCWLLVTLGRTPCSVDPHTSGNHLKGRSIRSVSSFILLRSCVFEGCGLGNLNECLILFSGFMRMLGQQRFNITRKSPGHECIRDEFSLCNHNLCRAKRFPHFRETMTQLDCNMHMWLPQRPLQYKRALYSLYGSVVPCSVNSLLLRTLGFL